MALLANRSIYRPAARTFVRPLDSVRVYRLIVG
jgi:hypothetical protein